MKKNYTEEERAYAQGWLDGGKAVLEELASLFEGVEDTDVWKDFFDISEEK